MIAFSQRSIVKLYHRDGIILFRRRLRSYSVKIITERCIDVSVVFIILLLRKYNVEIDVVCCSIRVSEIEIIFQLLLFLLHLNMVI